MMKMQETTSPVRQSLTSSEKVIELANLLEQADERNTSLLDRDHLVTAGVYLLCIAMILGSRTISPALGSWSQVETILVLSSFLIVGGFGQGIVILLGGLDLSIAATIMLGGLFTALWIGVPGGSLWLLPVVLLICAGAGALNGTLVAFARTPAFIATMASGITIYSLCLGYTQGTVRGSSPELLTWLMTARILGLPTVIWFVAGFIAFAIIIQNYTVFGRYLYAVGSNPAAARVAGLPVSAVIITAYAISGLCGGLVGMMLVGYANGATLRMGDAYLLPTVSAVVVGGASILGGKGNFIGTVGGAILLTTLSMLITAAGLPQGWRTIVEGGVIIAALLMLNEGMAERAKALLLWRPRGRSGSQASEKISEQTSSLA